ncbi:MAG: hypothetical protein V4687_19345 [Bacteroidota bacterium]
MFKLITLLLAFLLSTACFTLNAQQATAVNPGTAKGIVRDTAQNYVLKSATVSVYKAADSTLLSYQVTNNYGEFSFKNLPVNILLRLDVNNIGYATSRKTFTIPSDKNTIDLKTIIANRKDITLDDVVITVPPISMNGDTLEFNAAAFKLDSNAVVEDLLRQIPNITLWGDGQITVNGKEVKSLLVNGKSFFGGDMKLATQNLAKNAVQKIQVYNKSRSEQTSNPADSTLEMNIKLKKGKDIGYFGKIGAGYGTDGRFETDASINMFSPKMQLAVVGAINNINKIADNTGDLMSNSTFKGVGTNVEYQPDFRAEGITRPIALGANFTYNFIEKPTWELKNTLKSNYFLQDKNTNYLSDYKTTTSVNSTDKVIESSNTNNQSSNSTQRFDSNYEYTKKGHNLNFSQEVNFNRGDNVNQTFRTATNLQDVVTSTNNTMNTGDYNNKNFRLGGQYQYSPYIITQDTRFRGMDVSYNLNAYNNQNETLNLTEFKSFTGTAVNQKFNRKYNTLAEGFRQETNLSVRDLKGLIFGNKKFSRMNVDLTNRLLLNSDKNDNNVEDLDTLNNVYRENAYLDNRITTNVIEETPGLKISRGFSKSMSNRYYKNLNLSFRPKQLLIRQENKSDRSFQNITRNYSRFAPDASVSYYNHQYGETSRNYELEYQTTMRIPTINQLAPLTDSTNLYNLRRGNINLKESVQRELSFSFSSYDQSSKNNLNYNVTIRAGLIADNIVDSLIIDEQNRRTVYNVNADGHKYLNGEGNIRKTFKLKTSEIQLNIYNNFNTNRNPGYTNNVFTYSRNLNTYTSGSVNYTYKSYLAVALSQSWSTYKSKQEAFNTQYSGKNVGTTLTSSYNITKKLTLNSNISNNTSTSSNANNIVYTIWNANVVYRFLKGNNAEVKFAALDLLRQNTSVINYGDANSFTIGTQNVLKQYFMTTLSYYPRQFGKKAMK